MILKIKVIPNSKKEEIIEGNPLVLRIKEIPEKNKANIAVIKILSKHFNTRVRIINGLTSKNKIIEF